ncbi:MAG: response regulator transcription factor [Bacteroidales bacterium]
MKRLSILFIEPSFLVREGLKTLLSQMNQSFSVEEADDKVADLPKLIRKSNPNLILVNPVHLDAGFILPRNAQSKIVFVAISNEQSDPRTEAKFDFSIGINDPKHLLVKQFNEIIEKTIGSSQQESDNSLTERELAVLKLVALGLTNNDIGEKLFISIHTVMTHRKNITRKLGIKTVSGLTVYAILNKLIKAEEL